MRNDQKRLLEEEEWHNPNHNPNPIPSRWSHPGSRRIANWRHDTPCSPLLVSPDTGAESSHRAFCLQCFRAEAGLTAQSSPRQCFGRESAIT